MQLLIIGYGSIGKRHARLGKEMGHSVHLVTSQSVTNFPADKDLQTALKKVKPDAIIISNRTNDHANTLAEIRRSGFKGKVLVEKPLCSLSREIQADTSPTFVAYNLRFHPIVEELKKSIAQQKMISAQLYVGQNLKNWRPNTDYRESYSAHKEMGGGVLRDLSHELDTLTYLCGPVSRVTALGGKRSQLEINSEDCVSVLLETKSGTQVTLELNYIDHNFTRFIHLNANDMTLRGDLISGVVNKNGKSQTFDTNRDETFKKQLQALESNTGLLCSMQEGLATVQLIEAIEKSIERKEWVSI